MKIATGICLSWGVGEIAKILWNYEHAPMNVKAFNNMKSKVADTYVNISKVSMTEAAEDLWLNSIQEGEPQDSVATVAASCDRTWQVQGYSSLNGVVTVISADTGKYLDYHVMSKHCDACNYHEDKKNT